jgi:hypothetical protein
LAALKQDGLSLLEKKLMDLLTFSPEIVPLLVRESIQVKSL